LNGLAGVTALAASIGLAIVARAVGDDFVFTAGTVLAASMFGFLIVNYPSGRIFLGDGGAYLIGLLLAELSVLLVQRNSEVSPWFPLVLLTYPIWETLFSMYRRKMRGYSTARADGMHLHQLVYRRLVRWRGFAGGTTDKVTRNSIASLVMWLLPLACLAASVASWQDSFVLQIMALTFVVGYWMVYRAFVRFSLPRWVIVRAGARSAALEGDMTEVAGPGR
jgi:UDP-GlcNAc:undecaprenyl-phosphate/decaprenyl-phosphate GlcNAc-1-phosphate transferase